MNLDSTSSFGSVFEVTPSDSVNFTVVSRALYVGTGGNVVVVLNGGTTATFVNVQSGTVLPVQAKRVDATDTTATDILGLN